jgi:hypothetical protein
MAGPVKSAAQANLEKLPAACYATLLTNGELIQIRAGEKGYYKLAQGLPQRICAKDNITMDQLADMWNKENGVTTEDREAMEIGSMWGWEVPGANVDIYKKDEIPF